MRIDINLSSCLRYSYSPSYRPSGPSVVPTISLRHYCQSMLELNGSGGKQPDGHQPHKRGEAPRCSFDASLPRCSDSGRYKNHGDRRRPWGYVTTDEVLFAKMDNAKASSSILIHMHNDKISWLMIFLLCSSLFGLWRLRWEQVLEALRRTWVRRRKCNSGCFCVNRCISVFRCIELAVLIQSFNYSGSSRASLFDAAYEPVECPARARHSKSQCHGANRHATTPMYASGTQGLVSVSHLVIKRHQVPLDLIGIQVQRLTLLLHTVLTSLQLFDVCRDCIGIPAVAGSGLHWHVLTGWPNAGLRRSFSENDSHAWYCFICMPGAGTGRTELLP